MSLVTPLKRTAIIVRDMDASLRFYRGVLGLNLWLEGRYGAELPALHKLLGSPPCTTRWVILQSGTVDWGMVGLFELDGPAPPDDRHADPSRANRGEACLVFHTPDVARVHRGARRLGLPIVCPPTRLELAGHGVASREMTIRDPNGVLLNFIQNVKGGSVGLSNRFPGLARRKPAAKAAAKAVRRRSAAAGRGRSG